MGQYLLCIITIQSDSWLLSGSCSSGWRALTAKVKGSLFTHGRNFVNVLATTYVEHARQAQREVRGSGNQLPWRNLNGKLQSVYHSLYCITTVIRCIAPIILYLGHRKLAVENALACTSFDRGLWSCIGAIHLYLYTPLSFISSCYIIPYRTCSIYGYIL